MNHKVSLPPISDILNTRHPSNAGVYSPHQQHQYFPPQPYQPHASAQQPPYYQQQPQMPPHFLPLNPISNKSRSSSASSDSSNYHYQSNLHLYKVNSNETTGTTSLSVGSTPSKSPLFGHVHKPSISSSTNNDTAIANASKTSYNISSPIGSHEAHSPISPGGDKRKVRNNLPKETTYILLKWLNDHLNHPYPNSFEKNQLMLSTGLNQQQLSNWFINARRRKIKVLKEQQRLNV